ncbi:MAG: TIGR02300 family protein [Rhodospirillaceae bacterium]|nr:TIGR02300 family protein [Rhodospirillaceae bacterium]MBT5373380.1 TIGR02300 family protein [Rhodospirillaceae bacterium]
MSKPEWGQKRNCQGCGARFYDLKKDPIICPKCGETLDPEPGLKSRRSRPPAAEKAAPPAAKDPVETTEDGPEKDEGGLLPVDGDGDGDGDDAAADDDPLAAAAELAADDDDLSEVVGKVESESKD